MWPMANRRFDCMHIQCYPVLLFILYGALIFSVPSMSLKNAMKLQTENKRKAAHKYTIIKHREPYTSNISIHIVNIKNKECSQFNFRNKNARNIQLNYTQIKLFLSGYVFFLLTKGKNTSKTWLWKRIWLIAANYRTCFKL